MPVGGGSSSRDPHQETASRLTEMMIELVYRVVPFLVIAFMAWLAVDAFRVSVETGMRALCAALLPVLIASYLRWMRPEWLAVLDRVKGLGLMVGAAGATLALLVIVTSDSGSSVLPEFIISFAFSAMLLARTDYLERGKRTPNRDETLLQFFFGISFALLVFGLFYFEG